MVIELDSEIFQPDIAHSIALLELPFWQRGACLSPSLPKVAQRLFQGSPLDINGVRCSYRAEQMAK